MSEIKILPILPLRDIVVFPHQPVPLFVGREKSVRALEEAMRAEGKQILLATQKDKDDDDPSPAAIYDVGVVATILQLLKLPDGTVKVLVEGKARVRITEFLKNDSFFEARAERLDETMGERATIEALIRSVAEEFEKYAKIKKNVPEEALSAVAETRARIASRSPASSRPFATERSRFPAIRSRPASARATSGSYRTTVRPLAARTWAIP